MKLRHNLKQLSILLAVLLAIQFVSIEAYATPSPDVDFIVNETFDQSDPNAFPFYNRGAVSSITGDNHASIVEEIESLRDRNKKQFRMSDGSILAAVYPIAVHKMENGAWTDIDNRLQLQQPRTKSLSTSFYRNANGIYDVSFSTSLAKKQIFTFQQDGISIELGLPVSSLAQAQVEQESVQTGGTSLPHLISKVSYENVWTDTDLEYILMPDRIKENIVVKSRQSAYSYSFVLQTGGLTAQAMDEKTIGLYKDGETQPSYRICAPYMKDAAGRLSDAVTLSLSDGQVLTITADLNWINDAARTFPVRIDPSIEEEQTVNSSQNASVNSAQPDQSNFAGSGILMVSNNGDYDDSRALLQFGLPPLTTADVVVDAKLRLTLETYDNNEYPRLPHYATEIHKITEPWNGQTVTWNSQPAFDSRVEDYVIASFDGGEPVYSYTLTRLVREWYQEGGNYGIMLRHGEEDNNYSLTEYLGFASASATQGQPVLEIRYVNAIGLEDYWNYHSAQINDTSVYVNDFNGDLTAVYQDIAMTGQRMPIAVSHVYSHSLRGTQPMAHGYNMNLGQGFRLSLGHRIDISHLENFPYTYTDGDGTVHYFTMDSEQTSYHLEGNDSVTLEILSAGGYRMHDGEDSVMQFDAAGKLLSISDANGNTQTISYANGRISSITDPAGRSVRFAYDADGYLTSMTDPFDRVTTYVYTNGFLTGVVKPGNRITSYSYDTQGALTSITETQGRKLSIEYYGTGVHRVKKITEYGTGNVPGSSVQFTYTPGETKVTDQDGKSETVLFDLAGRAVCVRDDHGNAVYGQYASTGNLDNKLLFQNELKKPSNNLIHPSGWSSYGTGGTASIHAVTQASTSTSNSFLSNEMLKVQKTNASGPLAHKQTVSIPSAGWYTFSAYVKKGSMSESTDGGGYLAMEYEDSTGVHTQKSESIVINSGTFYRYSVSLEVPQGVNEVTVYAGVENCTGTLYYSSLQLEENALASSYNLLENNTLEEVQSNAPAEWIRVNCASADQSVALTGRTGKGFQVTGEYDKDKRLEQALQIAGNQNDTFVLSGWGKADGVANNETHGKNFALAITFVDAQGASETQTVSFESYSRDWQYTSESFVAPFDFTSMKVSLCYDKNFGTAYFDDISLFREIFGTMYTYNDAGQLVQEIDRFGNVQTYTYTGEDLARYIYKKADETLVTDQSYTYDSDHNMTSTTDNITGITQTYTYDENGNPVTAASGSGTQTTSESVTYTADGNYVLSETDMYGKTTTYTYDTYTPENGNPVNRGLVHTVTDPSGKSVTYTYDGNTDEVLSMSSSGLCQGYTYSAAGQLIQIGRNQFTYLFASNAYGDPMSIQAGNRTLMSYAYEGANRRVKTYTYGNGDQTEILYDGQNRVVGAKDNNALTYRDTFDASGKTAVRADYAAGKVWTYRYDSEDRLSKAERDDGVTYRYAYDSMGQLITQSHTIGNTNAATRFTYNSSQQLATTTLPNGAVVGYSYDASGRPTTRQVTAPTASNGYRTSQVYETDSSGNPTDRIASVSYQRILGQSQTDGGSYSYTYDNEGNITQINKDGNPYASFVYDEHHQLVEEECYENSERIFYTYDDGGNLVSKEAEYLFGPSGTLWTKTYTYGDSDWHDLLTSFDGQAITYDGGGNPLSYRGWTMEWERGRQLTEMQKGSDSIAYQYDAKGIRTQKTVNNITTQYHWDNGKLICQTDGTHSMRFYYDVNGELVGLWDSQDGTCYYVKDGQGNIIRIVGTYGQTIAEYAYDAYGNILSAPNSGVGARNPFRYRGYYYDTETGFYYLQSRYYDPVVSRFINADVVMDTGSFIGTNLFAYCLNNPTNHVDDTGYWPKYYTPNYSSVNCYAYVLGLTKTRPVPGVPKFSSVVHLYNQVYTDLTKNLGRRAIKLGTNYYSTSFNPRYYYLIAMRVGQGGNKEYGRSWDYHFMVRHENLTWSHKPGSAIPSMYIGSARYHNPSTMNWALYDDYYPYPVSSCPGTNFNYYNYYYSVTYYIAVEKR